MIKEKLKALKSNKLVRNSIIYVSSDSLNKLMLFILLPFLSNQLTTAEYGYLANFQAVLMIGNFVLGLNLNSIIGIYYFKVDLNEKRKLLNSVFIILFLSLGLYFLIILILGSLISKFTQLPTTVLYLTGVISFLFFIFNTYLEVLRLEEKAPKYALVYNSMTFIYFLSTIVLIKYTTLKWQGAVWATFFSYLVFCFLALYQLARLRLLQTSLDFKYFKSSLKFGAPLIPHMLNGWLRYFFDRFLITNFYGLSQAGLYAVGVQIASPLNMAAYAVNKAFTPQIIKDLSTKDSYETRRKIVKQSYVIFASLLVIFVLIVLVLPILVKLFLSTTYQLSLTFFYWIAFSYVFTIIYYLVCNYLFYLKKTHILATITFSGSIIHVIISVILLKSIGPLGSSITTVISSFLIAFATFIISNKLFPMPWLLTKKNEAR